MSDVFTVVLPDIGEGVVEGEVIEWLKNIGDFLEQDEPVVLVMTDKATVELPAPYPGTLAKQHFAAGEIAIKDKPLYDITLAEGVEVAAKHAVEEKVKEPAKQPAALVGAPQASVMQMPSAGSTRTLAAPPVRAMAAELGIDLSSVPGSGPDGLVTRQDLARFTGGGATPATPITEFEGDQRVPLQGLRAIIAERMVESRRIIPDFSYFAEMEATRLVQLRKNIRPAAAREGIKVTFMPFFIRALSLTLKEYPQFNSSLDPQTNEIVIHAPHNVGIAVKTRLGLIVPVLKNVEQMSLEQIIRSYHDLVSRAQSHGLDPAEMRDGTITISNFGTVGGVWATPIINYPEVCILGLGRIEQRPIAHKGQLVIRDMLNLSWSCDHRVIDGDQCAAFSNAFVSKLQNPAQIL